MTGLNILSLVVGLTVHEWAHARTAFRAGDPTAGVCDRLSLNPLRHADPIGSFVVPALAWLVGLPLVGYGKPVPYDPRFIQGGPRAVLGVILAGPIANLLLAAAFAVLGLWWLGAFELVWPNLALAFFNLLPLPGLDGARALEQLRSMRRTP